MGGVKFDAGVAEPPEWLDDVAKAEFRRVVELAPAGYFQQVDLSCLIAYAVAFSDRQRYRIELAREGEKLSAKKYDKEGNLRSTTYYANPTKSFLQAAESQLARAESKLGFSPTDRSRMQTAATTRAKNGGGPRGGPDPLEKFLDDDNPV